MTFERLKLETRDKLVSSSVLTDNFRCRFKNAVNKSEIANLFLIHDRKIFIEF